LKLNRCVVYIAVFLLYFLSNSPINASDISISTIEQWNIGTTDNVEQVNSGIGIELSGAGSWGALTWKTPDKSISAGSAFTSDGTDIYVARGVGDISFWKYSPSTDSWTTLRNMPKGAYYGADLQYLNGNIYALFGGYQNTFAKYSISNDTWEILEHYPDLVYQGASMSSDGTNIYAITSNNTQSFYRYSVENDTWNLLASTPATLRAGSDLERVGDYIYTPRGNNTNTFYRYSISENSWDTMSVLPGTMIDDVDITSANGYIFVSRQYNTTSFYRYEIATDTWITLVNAPMTSRYAGVQYVSADGYVYFFRGNGDYRFWKYDIENDTFLGPSDSPNTLSTGSDMIYDNGYIYTPRGSNTLTLYRYNISANTWETMADSLTTFNDDVRGFKAGEYIYFFRGSNYTNFSRYNITTNTWEDLAVAPATVRYGGAIAYPGSGDYIYATRGSGTNSFWRYSISTNTWDTTVSDLPVGTVASYGATLVSDGSNIFFTSGIGTKRFYKYDILENSWTQLPDLPFAPFYGTDTTYTGNGKILALAGWYKTDLWEYDIADNKWRKLKNFAGYGATDIGTWYGASLVSDESGSFFMSRGGGRSDILVYSYGATDYSTYGTWTSNVYDLKYVESWDGVTLDQTIVGDSNIVIETRSSLDSINWSNWEALSSGNIASPTRRYLQIRVLLLSSSDGTQTPNIESIEISYTSDLTPPVAPISALGMSQEVGGVEITSGESYGYTNPSFTWDPATDTQTDIVGYYVYWGLDQSADPVQDGAFQTGLGYVANYGVDVGLNYLKIVAEDSLGNQSNPNTIFTYDYNGVSPILSLNIGNSDLGGALSSTQVTALGIQLESKSDGYWLEKNLTPAPRNLGYGSKNVAYSQDSKKFYLASGMNTNHFYEYDIVLDAWTELAPAPNTIYYGGGAVSGPEGYIYVARGNNSTEFWRYHIDSNTWDSDISSTPLTVGYGASMVFDGNQYIYMLRGNNSDFFWRYDTFQDSWEALRKVDFGAPSEVVSNNVYTGGNLVIDRENQLLYAIQGNSMAGFSVYDINTDTWTPNDTLPSLPSYGASLAYHKDTQAIYYMAGQYTPYLFKYDIASEQWEQLMNSPIGFYYGAGLYTVDDSLYAIRGGNTTSIYMYDIYKNTWFMPTRGLFGREFEGSSSFNMSYGADILKGDGDNFYITRGNYADDFMRWNEKTGELTRLPNTPVGMYQGGSMAYDNTQNKIYLNGGQYDSGLFVFNITENTWSEEVDDKLPYAVNAGSSMIYDGSQYIYLTRASANNQVYRFDTLGTAGTKWQLLTTAPSTLYYGSELLLKDGYLYTLRGYNTNPNPFYRYDIAQNSWATLSPLPSAVYNDGFLTDGNDGYFYAARGGNTNEFYRYNVSTDTWSVQSNFPGLIYVGGAGESNNLNMIHVLAGSGSNTYQDALYTYVMQTESSAFEEEGTYVSQVHDLESVYKWASLIVDYDINTNTNLVIETSSSSDNTNWSDWALVTKSKEINDLYNFRINSPAAQYIKLRFSMISGDGIYSPVVRGYDINYYQDLDEPTNPDTQGFTSSSSLESGTPIIANNWYNYASPYFQWEDDGEVLGASDGINGSGVAGYYVYWGTVADADPEELGVLTTDTGFAPTNLIDESIYHLRVRTVDDAGNVSEDTWEPFVYKYDSSGPLSIENLNVDPLGYTSINNFSFDWDEVVTQGAQVVEYCYKTGATTGEYSEDQCITENSITGIPSYRVGINTFYVRSKDEAGNYSPYTTASYFYVDAENAPAPPTNLVVSPTTSTQNAFGFTWDSPAVGTFYGSQANLSYLYSVNALPTEFSVSATSLRYLLPGAYATLPGENIFYIVTKDEAGNVNYNNYVSVSFFANTVAPGIPVNLEIADVSVKNTSSWRLAISWDQPVDEGSGVAGYQIYRSVDGENFSLHSFTSGSSLVDSRLIQRTYYYKVKACDSTNNCGAFSEVVELYPDGRFTAPAEIIVPPVISGITPKKASVSWITARTADSKVAYGTEPGVYFEEEVSNSDQVVDHMLTINNLSPGTKYYYIVKWTDEDGNTGVSQEADFETAPPPTIEEPIVKRVSLNSALIEFTTKDTIKVRVLYGETSSFGGMVEVYTGSAEGTHNVELADIKDGTKYYY
jgi:hypothetical protein